MASSNILTKIFGSRNERLLKSHRKTVESINALEDKIQALSDGTRNDAWPSNDVYSPCGDMAPCRPRGES